MRLFGDRYYREQVIKNRKKPTDVRRYLDNEIYPALGSKLLKDVSVLDVQALVYRKRDNGRIAAAMQLRRVLKYIIGKSVDDKDGVNYQQYAEGRFEVKATGVYFTRDSKEKRRCGWR